MTEFLILTYFFSLPFARHAVPGPVTVPLHFMLCVGVTISPKAPGVSDYLKLEYEMFMPCT